MSLLHSAHARSRTRTFAPGLEVLEDRLVLSGTSLAQVAANYGRTPLSFEANVGQTDALVDYPARGNGYTVFLTPTEAVLSLHKGGAAGRDGMPTRAAADAVVRMGLVGANPAAHAAGLEMLAGKVNYLQGNDPA